MLNSLLYFTDLRETNSGPKNFPVCGVLILSKAPEVGVNIHYNLTFRMFHAWRNRRLSAKNTVIVGDVTGFLRQNCLAIPLPPKNSCFGICSFFYKLSSGIQSLKKPLHPIPYVLSLYVYPQSINCTGIGTEGTDPYLITTCLK